MKSALKSMAVILFASIAAVAATGCKSKQPVPQQDMFKVKAPVNHALAPATNTPNCPSTGPSDEGAAAYCEFNALTNAAVTWSGPTDTNQPVWIDWLDKCDLGAGPCPEDNARGPVQTCPQTVADLNNIKGSALHADLLAIDSATQIVAFNHSIGTNTAFDGATPDTAHQLASVLFSSEICSEIQRLNGPAKLQQELANTCQQTGSNTICESSTSHLFPNSTAIKLIWEIVADDSTHVASVYNQSNQGGYVTGPAGWNSNYRVDTTNPTCPPDNQFPQPSAASAPPRLSVNCFYHINIDTTDQTIKNQLNNNQQNVVVTMAGKNKNAIAILVGIHIMVFDAAHPLWRWMTFYWTPQTNGQAWGNPWRHYSMETTSTPAEGQPLTRSTIANPYLEGHIDTLDSNCVSCHSLAVYNKTLPWPQFGQAIVAQGYIGQNLHGPRGEYPATETYALGHNYYNNAIRTHFLWSLVTNPLTDAPTAANARTTKPLKGRAPPSR